MLLRLSRVLFWLAAVVAAAGLFAPRGHETLLTAVSVVACAFAFMLWRSGAAAQRRSHAVEAAPPEPAPLNEAALLDAAAAIVTAVDRANSFEAALHAVARVLRSEIGARAVTVVEVRGNDAAQIIVSDLIESQPGFRAAPRAIRADAPGLARAIRTAVEAGVSPGVVALPVLSGERVVAAIELGGIDVEIEPGALTGLLRLARQALSRRALGAAAIAATALPVPAAEPVGRHGPVRGHVLIVEDNFVNPESTARMLQRLGCRVTPASGMLDALHALSRTQFDLVLVDLQLSGVDRLSRRDAGVPMIAIVGAGWPEDTTRLRTLGFDDHVCKPFRQHQMLAALNKHLPLRAPAESGESAGGAEPVLDPVALARLTELDPTGQNQLLERVLKAFQASVTRLRPQADAAHASGDRSALRLVAHTLKSSSASIGAMRLSQLCAQIETTIRTESGDDLDAQVDAMSTALDHVLDAIDRLLGERA